MMEPTVNTTIKRLTSTVKNNSGQHIFYRNWKPSGIPKAIVLIVHGLNSHSAYYQDFALELNESNFEVYAIDWRGRGRSDGKRYYIGDYRDVIDDINKLVNIAKTTHPAIPLFVIGHSAGGVFASVYTLLYQSKLQGLVTESFAFEIPAPAIALAIMQVLGYIVPYMRLVKLNSRNFSRDEQYIAALNNDPLLHNEKQPARTMQQLLFASALLKKEMATIKLPLLIMHGTADKSTLPSGSKYFMKHAGSADKELKLYDGYYHDLLHDKGNMIITHDIINWLNERS